jgi:diacylglycerol kinase family enzyme
MPAASGDSLAPLVIVNPRAARLTDPLQRDRVVTDVISAVRRRFGVDPRVEAESLDAARAALAASTGAALVVVVGGDGTVREAAEALAGSGTALAVVPGGTGNVLARSLRITGIGSAVEAIRDGVPRVLDLGRARWTPTERDGSPGATHQRLFVVACGMGLDARIMARAEHEWKRRMRFGAYVGATFRALFELESARFRIVADGELLEIIGYLVLVANAGELIPGRVGPREPIDPTDGRLDLIVLGGTNPLMALHGATELMLRAGAQHDRAIRRPVRHVVVEAEPTQPIETDGDPRPAGRLEATVIPSALTILTPPR